MSDDDLTQAAAGGFPQTVNGVTVTDPRVRVETDRVRLTASAKVFFGSTQFVMTAVPTVTDGRIDVTVDSATIAGLSLPSETRASIADTVRATITKLVPASVRVTSVSFAPGALTVRGIQP
ncbi:MAG TPA: LmeA family phospholipid-binding protein [Candidatus Limnocylindria bacterium]|nr:LmeA family phospholipid-binding protein [Candidatus Limnocylindria bacterium]